MNFTGQHDFNFTAISDAISTAYLYSGTISKPLLEGELLEVTEGGKEVRGQKGYYEFIKDRRIRKKSGPDLNYSLVATGMVPSAIYSTPHGISYNDINFSSKAGVTGDFNFYMAFYGPGYYQPRVGELLTFGEISHGLTRPLKIQIDDLNSTEALKIFGLRFVGAIKGSLVPYSACKSLGDLAIVHEGTADCPTDKKPPFKFEALPVELSAGTYMGGIGGNPYNHNPLPSPYDRGVHVAKGLYLSKYDGSKKDADGLEAPGCYYEVKSDKPIPAFDIRGRTNEFGGVDGNVQSFIGGRLSDGNASVCYAGADGEDSSVLAYLEDGAGGSPPHGVAGSPVVEQDENISAYGDFSQLAKNAYWHYAFKYNHYTLPFGSTNEAGSMVEKSLNNTENEDHWWEHRECPENADFLNHAFGNNITACPMNYLDVPYYASIGKFGYFGTRFQDTWKYIKNEDVLGSAEDGEGEGEGEGEGILRHVDYPVIDPGSSVKTLDTEQKYSPRGVASSPIPTDKDYDDLIMLSAIERDNYSFFISDQILFLRLNYEVIKTTTEYAEIKKLNKQFEANFKSLLFGYLEYNSSAAYFSHMPKGLSHAQQDLPLSIFSNDLGTNFTTLVKKYGYVKVNKEVFSKDDMKSDVDGGAIDSSWYNNLVSNKLARISNRYFVNIGLGKPVDLFPEGIITFSSERASEFAESNFLKYHSMPSAPQLKDPETKMYEEIPSTNLRYFHTAFSTQSEANLFSKKENEYLPEYRNIYSFKQGVSDKMNPPAFNITKQTESFYFGYLNPRGCKKMLPNPSRNLLRIINTPDEGIWKLYAPETDPEPSNTDASPPRVFSEEGTTLDKNFSCFSPLFLQQPINTTTKSYLPATFRVFAVDYHSITEDKILENSRNNGGSRPEIAYWLRKIKAINSKGQNLYPLKYKWYRILNSNIAKYLKTKDDDLLEEQNSVYKPLSERWCSFEGENSPDCTVLTPSECKDLSGNLATFPGTREEDLSFFVGPNKAIANAYHYFCRVIGRFGWRDSELAKIKCESTVEMEFAYINSAQSSGGSFTIKAGSTTIGQVKFSTNGLQPDECSIFEDVEERSWNSGNDCESWRYVGSEGVGGVTRVWTPGTLKDPRGKTITRSHWTAFGELAKVKADNEELCKELYAKRALPYCDLNNGVDYAGVGITSNELIHRTAANTATLTYNSRVGLVASRMRNIAELYPPPSMDGYVVGDFPGSYLPSLQPGQFQFENNLGLIQRFSRSDEDGPDNVMDWPTLLKIGGGPGELKELIGEAKKKIFGDDLKGRVISGVECGYFSPTFGRFMHFYVETFHSFYSMCGKKKVKNISHVAGGLRANHAGLQFNWLGRPKNARLKRESMPGPYGFQWKVERHNRDRSGNGMSLGFWSYFWEERIENMYDAAAVVGALKRINKCAGSSKEATVIYIKGKRNSAATSVELNDPTQFRNRRFGPDLGKKLGCGEIRIKDEEDGNGVFKPSKEVMEYSQTRSAQSAELKDFGCNGVNEKDCFLPCVSLKWPDGFSPKGKRMVSGTVASCASCSEEPKDALKVISNGSIKKIWRKKISACSDGNRDTCNYITPTIHLGIDCWLAGQKSSGLKNVAGLLAS